MKNDPLKIVVNFSLTVNLSNSHYAKLGGQLEGVAEKEEDNIIKFDALYKELRDKVITELLILKSTFKTIES